jgi:hypothetical protein
MLYYKLKKAQLKLFVQKKYKQAQKIAFAVVVLECLLVALWVLALHYGLYEFLQPKVVHIEVIRPVKAESVKIEPKDDFDIEAIADQIWLNESTRGKNNYSKCEAIGKVNGIGYGIWGSNWQCFDSHNDEMKTLRKWVQNHINEGMTERELLCHYSGGNYEICK